jgi:hypothetical protein
MPSVRRKYLWAVSYALLASTVACSGDATAPDFTGLPGGDPVDPPAPTVAEVSLSPTYRTASPGETVAFTAHLYDAAGRALSGPTVEWSSVDPELLQVDATGRVSPQHAGVGRVVAHSGTAVDTALVAVLGAHDLLVSALPTGTVKASRAPGQEVSIPVTLDLSRVSSAGDLGAIQFDVSFDPAVLEYVSSAVSVAGVAAANLVEPGRVRFAFAGTEAQGKALIPLMTLTLRVKSQAAAGSFSGFAVSFVGQPMSTGFDAYQSPMSVAGTVVVAPS